MASECVSGDKRGKINILDKNEIGLCWNIRIRLFLQLIYPEPDMAFIVLKLSVSIQNAFQLVALLD